MEQSHSRLQQRQLILLKNLCHRAFAYQVSDSLGGDNINSSKNTEQLCALHTNEELIFLSLCKMQTTVGCVIFPLKGIRRY